MLIVIRPGSPTLQLAFYALAVVVTAASLALVAWATSGTANGAAARRRFMIGAAAWIGLVTSASTAGIFLPRTQGPQPFALLLVGVVVLGVVIARSSAGEALATRVPLAWLVGLQAFRLPLELAMHRAYTEGLMPVQMSYSGRNFDIVTGATAVLLAVALWLGKAPRALVIAWNVLGLVLLANIVGVAVLSTPMVAYFGPDRLNVWVTWMPYTLLPAVMVLAAWAGHLVIFRALSRR